MLLKFNGIIIYSLISFLFTIVLFPFVIKILKSLKAWIVNRELSATGDAAVIFNELHKKKNWTPTMWGIVFLIVMTIMILWSLWVKELWYINNRLVSRQETYIILFGFYALGILWLVDDWTKIAKNTKINWLGAIFKLVIMIWFSIFISYRFNVQLGVNFINLWPIDYNLIFANITYNFWLFSFSWNLLFIWITFFITLSIINAINITDGLDGLVGGMMTINFMILWIITFAIKRYLATTIIGIMIGMLVAYLWYNISPAKIFMWDSWSLALGGMTSTLLYLIWIKIWFIFPFFILMLLFWVELLSSALQIFWKKTFKRKLFLIAPFHHLLEKIWLPEANIVMKFWLLQSIIATVTLIMIMYQIFGS